MDKQCDAVLVAEALAGREEAYAALIRQYQNYAYGVAIGILTDFELAQDVVQEAFLCTYRDLAKLRDPARFGHWLSGIVRHLAHDALRERARVRRLAQDMRQEAEPFARAYPQEGREDGLEHKALVRRALQRLSAEQREVISLYYVSELSYAEIADFLELKETTVKGRMQHARAKLRKELKMVEEQLENEGLPADFSDEIQRLLNEALRRDERPQAIADLAALGTPAVDPLCEALDDRRQWVRYAAALALCTIGDERAAQPMLRLLYSQHFTIHFNELPRVLSIPGIKETLLKAVRRGADERHRHTAVLCLRGAEGDGEVFDELLNIFRAVEEAADLRRVAMQALCDIRPSTAADILAEAMENPQMGLRRQALIIAGGTDRLPPLQVCHKVFVEESDWLVRLRAARLMCEHGADGEEALHDIVRKGTVAERLMAALFLAHMGSEEAQNLLRSELLGAGLQEEAWEEWLAFSRDGRYDPGDVGALLANISTSKRQHHLMAKLNDQMYKLARQDPHQIGPLVEGFLEEGGHPGAQAVATRVLARQRNETFLAQLRRYLSGQLQRTQKGKAARRAFWEVFRMGEKALPMVEDMFVSENWMERKAAVALLRRWGRLTPAQQAQAVDDPHIAVRQAAVAGAAGQES